MLNRRRVSISMSFCSSFLSFSAWELHFQNEQNAYYAVVLERFDSDFKLRRYAKNGFPWFELPRSLPAPFLHSILGEAFSNLMRWTGETHSEHRILRLLFWSPITFKFFLLLWSIRQPLHNILSPCHVENGHGHFHNPPLEVLVVRCKKIYLALAHSVRDAIIRICTSDHSRFSSVFHRFQYVVQFDTEGQALLIQLERRTWSSECMTHRGYPLRFRAVAIYF